MIDEEDHLPFLARFANPLPETIAEPINYDETRQVAQIRFDRSWVDARKARQTAGMEACPTSTNIRPGHSLRFQTRQL